MTDYVFAALVISFLIQVVAAGFALRLLARNKGTEASRRAWLFIALALLLMVTRRAATLIGHAVPSVEAAFKGPVAESIALGIAVLMLAGVLQIASVFERKRKVAEELHESLRQYRRLFEQHPMPMWVYDTDSLSFLAVNEAAIHHYGYSRDEFLGMDLRAIRPTEDVPALMTRVERRRLSDEPYHGGKWRHRTKSGTIIDVEVTSYPTEFGGRRAVLVLLHDITDKLRAEALLRQIEDQLRQSQKLEAIGKFAGGITHDFNNLLTVITGYSELVLSSPTLDRRDRSGVEEVRKAGERAAGLTRQLLAFSRQQVLQPKVLDLNAVVADMDRMIRRLIGEDMDVRTVLSPDLGRVRVDPSQMEQILLNLVVNARDAMPDGGKLTIETANVELGEDYASAHPGVVPGAYVMMAVSDSGEGMTPETLGRIFEPFFTTKESNKGTGLGLSTVYGIVKQSEGSIWVYSEPGRGATFKVYLPRVYQASEPKAVVVSKAAAGGRETVLVVEDEESLRTLLAEVLRSNGYTVVEAGSGAAALIMCKQREDKVHLVITDLVMPGMGGVELVKRLSESGCEPRVLFISGYSEAAMLHQQAVPERIAFLPKPFPPARLVAKVKEVLAASPSTVMSA